jgi:argininosuccinate synthase
VSLDGVPKTLLEVIAELGALAGSTGYGRIDMVENRRVGIKSREVYEAPGALALIAAHQDLESITLERDVAHEKLRLEPRFAEVVYDGLWFSPLREALSAFVTSTQRHVTGEVRMRFSPGGGMAITGRRSPVALYDYGLATYDRADTFRHQDAEGFVRVFGLGLQTWASRQGADGKDPSES